MKVPWSKPKDFCSVVKSNIPRDAYPADREAREACNNALDIFCRGWDSLALRSNWDGDIGEMKRMACVVLLLSCEKHNSRLPILVMRQIASHYPQSGLAWYCVACACIALGDKGDPQEFVESVKKAYTLGCDYARKGDNGELVIRLVQHPEIGMSLAIA